MWKPRWVSLAEKEMAHGRQPGRPERSSRFVLACGKDARQGVKSREIRVAVTLLRHRGTATAREKSCRSDSVDDSRDAAREGARPDRPGCTARTLVVMSTPTITYRRDVPLVAAEVARVYESSGIRRPTHDLARIAHMLGQSNLVFTAWKGEQLVGIARSLTDFAWSCYLADLAVSREMQRAGIGRELVRRTLQAIGPGCALVLNSAPEAMEYYPKIGLEKLDTAFTRRRSE